MAGEAWGGEAGLLHDKELSRVEVNGLPPEQDVGEAQSEGACRACWIYT